MILLHHSIVPQIWPSDFLSKEISAHQISKLLLRQLSLSQKKTIFWPKLVNLVAGSNSSRSFFDIVHDLIGLPHFYSHQSKTLSNHGDSPEESENPTPPSNLYPFPHTDPTPLAQTNIFPRCTKYQLINYTPIPYIRKLWIWITTCRFIYYTPKFAICRLWILILSSPFTLAWQVV